MIQDILLTILSAILIACGLIGIFLPLLPGVPMVWLGLVLYAFITGFKEITILTLLIFLGLTLITILIDFIAPIIGAKTYKASMYGLVGAFSGLILGLSIFGPLGIILGPLLGGFLGEILAGKESRIAAKTALGAFVGFATSALIKLIVALTMLGFFIAAIFF